MSQSNAETSNFSIGETEEFDRAMENEVQNGLEVKVCIDDKVEAGSEIVEEMAEIVEEMAEIVEEMAEIEADDGKKYDEPDAYIQFLFDPEIHETILNEYVINKISKYLDFQDLKSLRAVNKLWSAGSTPQLFKNSAISLIYRQRNEEQLAALGAETAKLKGIQGLNINLLLFFGFDFDEDREVEMFQELFANLSPSLQALELQYWSDEGFFLRGGTPINLPALTSFTLKEDCLRLGTEKERRFFQCLYASAPNLVHLEIQHFRPSVLSPLLHGDGSRNWTLAPKLSSLTLNASLYFSFNTSSELWPLANFPQPWEALDITLAPFNEDDFEALFRLLDKNKDCLVRLKLDINDVGMSSPPQTAKLSLPANFTKLEKLELDFWDLRLHSGLTFGGRGLLYSQVMPRLTSLSLKLPQSVQNARGIWNSLFPRQVFRGLKALKIVGLTGLSNISFSPINSQEIGQNLGARIFPQATIEIV